MPTLTGRLAPEGAIISVELGLDRSTLRLLRTSLHPIPSPVSARALVDTGAEVTCADSSLIQALSVPVSGSVLANLPGHGGYTVGFYYDLGFTIVHPSGNLRDNLVVRSMSVLELSLAVLGYQVLIGRDLLARCHFLYSGLRNRFRLSY